MLTNKSETDSSDSPNSSESRTQVQRLTRLALGQLQLDRLNRLLDRVLPANAFYAAKIPAVPRPLTSLDQLAEFPYTYKSELIEKSAGVMAANMTYSVEEYVRFHRTSGTMGRPMTVLDTAEDWQWWIETWQYVLDAAQITPADRVVMAFSFGPFIGFWSAHDALAARGAMVIPAGGMSSLARIELMANCDATVVCCTPSYALHLAEVAEQNHIQLPNLGIRRMIVAGEPGGSSTATRTKIEQAWNTQVVDHAGATEIGPWGFGNGAGTGLLVIESEFVAEFHSLETGQTAVEGEVAELILTTLGRAGSPVIRYRTGDLVRPSWNHADPSGFVFLSGGILGRTDDMLVIRGVNIFPTSIEQILHSFPEVVEYRITATKVSQMDALRVEVEDRLQAPERIGRELELRLGLRVDVEAVPFGTLPRFEGKGRRFVDLRQPVEPV